MRCTGRSAGVDKATLVRELAAQCLDQHALLGKLPSQLLQFGLHIRLRTLLGVRQRRAQQSCQADAAQAVRKMVGHAFSGRHGPAARAIASLTFP